MRAGRRRLVWLMTQYWKGMSAALLIPNKGSFQWLGPSHPSALAAVRLDDAVRSVPFRHPGRIEVMRKAQAVPLLSGRRR
jgi:hypothetical protein